MALAGFDVAVVSIEPSTETADLLAEVSALGRNAIYFQQSIADIDLHAQLVNSVFDRLGPVVCLVNNAGVTSLRRGDLLALTPESFDRCIDVNLRGTFFLTQAVARKMIAADASPGFVYRSIVTITSANAEIIGLNRADYCMTKAGLSMASKLFAARLAHDDIHVFELRPGIIQTDMTAPAKDTYDHFIANDGVLLGRWGTPDEVGTTVATIALGKLPFATGEILNVGGGLHLHRV